jgi:hypothetical protein
MALNILEFPEKNSRPGKSLNFPGIIREFSERYCRGKSSNNCRVDCPEE